MLTKVLCWHRFWTFWFIEWLKWLRKMISTSFTLFVKRSFYIVSHLNFVPWKWAGISDFLSVFITSRVYCTTMTICHHTNHFDLSTSFWHSQSMCYHRNKIPSISFTVFFFSILFSCFVFNPLFTSQSDFRSATQ